MPYTFIDTGNGELQNLDDLANQLRQQIDNLPPGDPQQLAHQALGQQTGDVFLVVVRDNETPHIHPQSDLIFSVLEGGGYVELPNQGTAEPVPAPAGMTVRIPQGVCHAYYNTSPTDSVLLVTFSPGIAARADCPPAP